MTRNVPHDDSHGRWMNTVIVPETLRCSSQSLLYPKRAAWREMMDKALGRLKEAGFDQFFIYK